MYANQKIPDWKKSDEAKDEWNRVYHQRMDELTIKAGLHVDMKKLKKAYGL
jgi:hypothetical protein